MLAAILAAVEPAAAQDPVTGLVHSFFGGYRPASPPVSGNCEAVVAAIGPEAIWVGTFSGKRLQANDRYNAYGAKACFETEIDCRIWQQRAITYALGPVQFTSCRPGAGGLFR
jgi:hypothetical protein